MTNGYVDIKNTDMMLIMGGNPAENHPCGFKWAIEAKRTRNAKMIVVDPRFTRTAATSDLFLQIRAGSDIAFLGGVIRYAIENNRIAHEYLTNFTNAAFIVKQGFKLPEDGLYSGFDPATQIYDKSTWNYEEGGDLSGAAASAAAATATHGANTPAMAHPAESTAQDGPQTPGGTGQGYQAGGPVGAKATESTKPTPMLPPKVAYDLTLQHPRCVFQLLKQQYSRYTPEMVERITGIPKNQFLKSADLFTSIRKDGDMKQVATIMYAVGWTQHTFGTQIIRTAAMLQLLLGNVGRAGGGVNALRGHSNIQGGTDMGGVFDIWPGYLKVPNPADVDLSTYLKRTTPTASKPAAWDSFNYWSNTSKFVVSFLKALYGDAARKENDWAFHYMPKLDRNYSWTEIWDHMYRGSVKGMFAFGMNGVAIGPDSQKNIEALKKADWLVVGEIYPDETSEFWRSPGISSEEMKTINTTVYRLPCAGFAEKDGSFPEHYEPFESPVQNALHPNQSNNPVVKRFSTPADKYGTASEGFNIICTTYRLTEHYHYWTKNNPMSVQLIPEPFVEIPVELAQELGIQGNDTVKVTSARSHYIAKAFVTKRIKPMAIDGKKIYQIGIPIHQGYRGIKEDESRNARTIVNRLTPTVTDPNAYTPEFKGFLVKLEKA